MKLTKITIPQVIVLLRNYYETGDPMATGELFHLLVLKYVTNEQIRETIREISLMDSTIDPNAEL